MKKALLALWIAFCTFLAVFLTLARMQLGN